MKIAGRDSNKLCVIIENHGNGFVTIDGETRRKKVNMKHLEPTKKVLKIKKGASREDVKKAFKTEMDIELKDTKPKKIAEKPKKQKAKKEAPIKQKSKKQEKTEKNADKTEKAEAKETNKDEKQAETEKKTEAKEEKSESKPAKKEEDKKDSKK